ncbi:MAG: hypothetical protein A2912_03070 [Candidatus Buchananbacteria bacterium RIFCSPLOWO2_01_FULL_40_23b]|uniref:Uncharacterized protein n=1 Tax=Candidatus Buchananbacteria bacterium RIFCSPLOWO2_01_FULL_40_23b TaxID=1797544 RepID=A0A1G1YUA1_9BACT|nr:MAG: hypothetical protein A2912_03070 [Candidatus Buchananbacteria bacterium RIFCSPLOWO2_01_FULL_40_23b]
MAGVLVLFLVVGILGISQNIFAAPPIIIPTAADHDRDGYSNVFERANGSDPEDAQSIPIDTTTGLPLKQDQSSTDQNAKPKNDQPFESFFVDILGVFVGWIIGLLGSLITLLAGALAKLMAYNDFIKASAVQTGWTIVRDVSNLFFVLILLIIAIGTILRIENYSFKKLLPKVIIMAVLVNFSKTIAGLIIDFAQVVMMTFAASFIAIISGNLFGTLHIQDIIQQGKEAAQSSGEDIGFINLAVTGLIAILMLIVAAMVILVILVVILMRMIMLWILVVLSPLAYILAAFPQGQRYAQQWWQEFSKYVIIGPVLAFFLWLSFSIAGEGGAIRVNELQQEQVQNLNGVAQSSGVDARIFTGIGNIDNFLSYIIGIGMLMGALMITQQMGVAGGSFAGSMFNRIRQGGLAMLKAPFAPIRGAAKLGWKGIKAGRDVGLEVLGARTGIELRPSKWKEGWETSRKKHREEREYEMYKTASRREGLFGALATPGHAFTTYYRLTGREGRPSGFRKIYDEGFAGGKYIKNVEQLEAAEANQRRAKIALDNGDLYEAGLKFKTGERFEEFLKRAPEDLSEEEKKNAFQGIENRVKREFSDRPEELVDITKDKMKSEAQELEIKAQALMNGDFSDNQKQKRSDVLAAKRNEQIELQRVIAIKNRNKEDTTKEQQLLKAIKDEIKNLSQLKPTAEERKENKEINAKEIGNYLQQTQDIRMVADQPLRSEIERKSDYESASRTVDELGKIIAETRPEVNYELRRQQRLAIAQEKKDMTTDSSDELISIFEDAKKNGDVNRMGAALLRLTETANENEIFNTYGYRSDALGLKDLTYEQLVGKRGMSRQRANQLGYDYDKLSEGGMSEEQALALANDISYAAEDINHWQVARAVGIKNGRQVFQDEDDRLIEVMAETRKTDFENFLRRSNRLAFGYEVPEGATREERAANFRRTGKREFFNSPFGLAFFREHAPKFEKRLDAGRFNVNWAINLSSKTGRPEVEDLINKMPEQERIIAQRIYNLINQFAGEEQGKDPFGDLKRIISDVKTGQIGGKTRRE